MVMIFFFNQWFVVIAVAINRNCYLQKNIQLVIK